MQKEPNLSKRPWKNILNKLLQQNNYFILSVNTNTKQLYFQLQKLFTDKRLRTLNLRILIRKHLYGPLPKKIHITIYQDIFVYIPQVCRRYIFYVEKQ